MMQTANKIPNDQKSYQVKDTDLPLHCPLPQMSLWNSHPRVFLPVDKSPSGKVKCPYCGTDYILVRTPAKQVATA
jgi:uncharacterized Zn-finger protein